MTFLARIVRFIFWLLVVSWSVALLRRLVGWMLRKAATAPQPSETPATSEAQARRLVRDPVCGVHIAEVLAIPLREGSEVLHFCSAACRDEYIGGAREFVASA